MEAIVTMEDRLRSYGVFLLRVALGTMFIAHSMLSLFSSSRTRVKNQLEVGRLPNRLLDVGQIDAAMVVPESHRRRR